jgi:hypothetical protein
MRFVPFVMGDLGQALHGDVIVRGIQFRADELTSFEQRGHAGRAAAGERIEDYTARWAYLHEGAHQCRGFTGDVVLVGLAYRFDVITGQVTDLSAWRHVAFAAPYGVFGTVTKAPRTARASGGFAPRDDTAPRCAGHLHRIGGARELAPVGKQHDGRTGLGDAQGFGEPQRHPERPTALVAVVAAEGAVVACRS